MSVIFGKYDTSRNILKEDLVLMKNSLNYWDADDVGLWKKDNIGLGHLMLWNTPESLQEKLPSLFSQSNCVITADARIDNREELILKLGIIDINISDSQLILKSYEKWNEDCVKHLYGVFAFVVWDEHKQELFCARDHIGTRPFFYYHDKGEFIFATALQGLKCFKKIPTTLKDNYAFDYFLYLDFDYNKSIYKHIHLLPPAHYAIVNKKGITLKEYWDYDVSKEIHYKNPNDYVENFKELLTEAVKVRTRTVYPIGAHLSGGLDSSGIVAYAQPFIKEKKLDFHNYGFTLPERYHGVEPPYRDEREVMEMVRNHLNIENFHHLNSEGRNYLTDIQAIAKRINGPFAYSTLMMTLITCDVIQKKGIRTLLSGGYGNYGVSYKWNNHEELFKDFRWLELLKGIHDQKGNTFVNIAKFLKKNYKEKGGINEEIYQIIHPNLKKEAFDYMASQNQKNAPYKLREQQIEKLKKARPRRYQDSLIALSNKVDYRYPLADVRLLEYFVALPANQKYDKGINRIMFRKSLDHLLPHYIVWDFYSNIQSLPHNRINFRESLKDVEAFILENKTSIDKSEINLDYINECIEKVFRSNTHQINYQNIIYKVLQWTIFKKSMS